MMLSWSGVEILGMNLSWIEEIDVCFLEIW